MRALNRRPGLVDFGHAVDDARRREVIDGPVQSLAVRAHRPRRVPQTSTRRTPLGQQPFVGGPLPIERGVAVDADHDVSRVVRLVRAHPWPPRRAMPATSMTLEPYNVPDIGGLVSHLELGQLIA